MAFIDKNTVMTLLTCIICIYIGWLLGSRLQKKSNPQGISNSEIERQQIVFPCVTDDSYDDLVERIQSAKHSIVIFGLTRNFFAKQPLRDMILDRAQEVDIKFFMADPECTSRSDRYRVEPTTATYDDVKKYKTEIESEFLKMQNLASQLPKKKEHARLSFFYYNFPCQTAIERFDESIRVSLYGINKQGRESPIWVYTPSDGDIYSFFRTQLDWVETIESGYTNDLLKQRNIKIVPIDKQKK